MPSFCCVDMGVNSLLGSYLYIHRLACSYWRSLFVQQMVTDTDTANGPMCREQETVEGSSVNRHISITFCPIQAQDLLWGRRQTIRSVKTEVSVFLSYHSTGFHRVCLRRRSSLFFFSRFLSARWRFRIDQEKKHACNPQNTLAFAFRLLRKSLHCKCTS